MKIGKVEIDAEGWAEIWVTENSRHFHVNSDVIVCVFTEKSTDDEVKAREKLIFHEDYIKSQGKKMGLVVFIDNLVALCYHCSGHPNNFFRCIGIDKYPQLRS